jgi:hypothetical protein
MVVGSGAVLLLLMVLKPSPGPELRRDQAAYHTGAMAFGRLAARTGAIGYVGTNGPLRIRLPGETVSPDALLLRFPDADLDVDAIRRGHQRCESFIKLSYHSLCVTWHQGTRIGGTASKGGYTNEAVLRQFRFETEYIADDYNDDAVTIQYWSSEQELVDRFDARGRSELGGGEVVPALTEADSKAALDLAANYMGAHYNTSGFRFDTPFSRLGKAGRDAIRRFQPVTSAISQRETTKAAIDVFANVETWGNATLEPKDRPTEVVLLPRNAADERVIRPISRLTRDGQPLSNKEVPADGFVAQFALEDFRHGDWVEFRYESGRTKRREIILDGVR